MNIRSPLSNNYFPPLEDGKFIMPQLRELEVKFNKIFSVYAKHYYSPSAISSVYITELGEKFEEGFLVIILIKNSLILFKQQSLNQKRKLKKVYGTV
jgi:hypothetical protein